MSRLIGGTGTPAPHVDMWNPALIVTEGWYDANDLSTIVESSSRVSQWNDKSGNLRHLVQSSDPLKLFTGIRTLNGLNVLDGDGSRWIGLNPFPVNADGNISIFGVFVVDLVNNLSDSLFAMDASGSDFKFCSASGGYAGPDFRGFVQGQGAGITLTGYPHNGPSIYHVEFDKTNSLTTARVDGISRGTAAYDVTLLPSQFFTVLADKNAVEMINGAVGEVIVVHDDLTQATREKIEGYLAWKWSLVANLDAGHPYKLTPPL